MRRVPTLLFLLWLTGASADGGSAIRGITLSTHTDGDDWAGDGAVTAIESIREVGAGWIAIHPYAGIRSDGGLRFRRIDPDDPPEQIARPIREAQQRGMKVLIKPHLAYWGSPFGWRGEIEFHNPEAWERFWTDYERWIVQLARATRQAEGFVVGTELDRTLSHESRWRRVIRRVRDATPAMLTYAANWTDFDRVPFWDALDQIGIQGYFPLVEENQPADEAAIRSGWATLAARLGAFSAKHDRLVLLTELGYNRSSLAAVRPWEHRTEGSDTEALQIACLRAALRAIEQEPRISGVFLWKWFPDPHPVGRNFQLATPALKQTIRAAWKRERRNRGAPH